MSLIEIKQKWIEQNEGWKRETNPTTLLMYIYLNLLLLYHLEVKEKLLIIIIIIIVDDDNGLKFKMFH